MKNTRQGGFTLIELIVVIVILGILAAFAVPRFMGMERQARIATLRSLGGSLQSAATLARGVWLAQGSPANPVVIEGQNINFVNGYPNAATVGLLLQDTTGFQVNGGANGRFRKTGATNVANCWVQYTQAANANTPPTITYSATLNNDC